MKGRQNAGKSQRLNNGILEESRGTGSNAPQVAPRANDDNDWSRRSSERIWLLNRVIEALERATQSLEAEAQAEEVPWPEEG